MFLWETEDGELLNENTDKALGFEHNAEQVI